MNKSLPILASLGMIATSLVAQVSQAETDPLPSWNDTETKAAIVSFVESTTNPASPFFLPVPERIATIDNDGTLWSEKPVYFQLLYALDQIKSMASEHPEWADTEPYKSVLNDDMKGLMASGMDGLKKIIATTHSGMTAEEFEDSVSGWLETARHPKTDLLYTEMVFQPMLELLDYLRANDYKTFIVSGGGIDFVRVFSESVYGIPPEQVVGTTSGSKFEIRNGIPVIVKESDLVLLDDKEGKPVGIYQHIGRRPVIAIGNSDGDLQMLQYTTFARSEDDQTPGLGLIVHHTDAAREWAYDRESKIGQLNKALDQSGEQGWVLIDMAEDWNQIYP